MERGVGTPTMLCRDLVVPEEERVALQGRSWALGMLTASCVWAGSSSFFYFSCPPQGFLYILLRGQLQLVHVRTSKALIPRPQFAFVLILCPGSCSEPAQANSPESPS